MKIILIMLGMLLLGTGSAHAQEKTVDSPDKEMVNVDKKSMDMIISFANVESQEIDELELGFADLTVAITQQQAGQPYKEKVGSAAKHYTKYLELKNKAIEVAKKQ